MTAEKELKLLTFEEFETQFNLIQNPFVKDGLWDNCGFETFGEALEFVKAQPQSTIWTAIEENDSLFVVSGYRFVNRLYYLISQENVPDTIQYMITEFL